MPFPFCAFSGNDVAMPKTLDDFNAEQRRLQEQTRLSQQNAAESLHAYRGNVDENELRRRAAAEELRRKEMEAKEGLHGYRGTFDGSRKAGANNTAKQAIHADVRAGERRDDVQSGNMNGYKDSAAGTSAAETHKSTSGVQAQSVGVGAEPGVPSDKQEDTILPLAAPVTPAPPAVPMGPAQKTFSFSFGLLCNSDSDDKEAMIGRVMDKINDIACNTLGGIKGAEYKTELKAYLVEAKDDPTYVDESGNGAVARRIVKVAVPYFILAGMEIPAVADVVQKEVIGNTRAACVAGELADVAKAS